MESCQLCRRRPINRERVSSMSDFSVPDRLLFDILLRLPPKDLIVCMCVCKAWNAVIHQQHFIKAHSQRSIQTNSHRTLLMSPIGSRHVFSVAFFDDDSFGREAVEINHPLKHNHSIVFYCNGLVCFPKFNDSYIWNPSIQRFRKMPLTPFEQPSGTNQVTLAYGFGYDSNNDDHKLVRIVQFADKNSVIELIVSSEVKVYSLKSNSWKRIQDLPRNDSGWDNLHGEFFNGALHWWLMNKFDDNRFMVLTLDLATEKYNEFPTPFFGDESDDSFTPSLHVMGGCLCICMNRSETRNDFWIMKEYGVAESWTMLYSIEDVFEYCTPLVFSKSGEMVLLNQDLERFVWYDFEKKRFEQVEIDGMPRKFTSDICVGNLYLLDGDPVTVATEDDQN